MGSWRAYRVDSLLTYPSAWVRLVYMMTKTEWSWLVVDGVNSVLALRRNTRTGEGRIMSSYRVRTAREISLGCGSEIEIADRARAHVAALR